MRATIAFVVMSDTLSHRFGGRHLQVRYRGRVMRERPSIFCRHGRPFGRDELTENTELLDNFGARGILYIVTYGP